MLGTHTELLAQHDSFYSRLVHANEFAQEAETLIGKSTGTCEQLQLEPHPPAAVDRSLPLPFEVSRNDLFLFHVSSKASN